jgi:hypothetical protein
MQIPKQYRLLGHISLLTMLLFSVVWVYSRVCMTDSAYQVFDLINSGFFTVNDGRYSMVVSELLPLLCLRLHAPLGCILIAYSVSFVLLAYGCYLIVGHSLKDDRTALAMVLPFLCMCHTFLHGISETFQLMFAAGLLYALMAYRRRSASKVAAVCHAAALLLVAAFCAFIHPVALFFFAFIWLYVWVDEDFRLGWETVYALFLFVTLVVLKFSLPAQGGHDATFLLPLPELLAKLPGFWQFRSLHFFKDHFFTFYYLPVLFLVWTSVFYVRCRRVWKVLFYLGYNLAFFFVTLWIYYAGDGAVGMERSFLPLVFFAGLPFVREVMPSWGKRAHQVAFMVLGLLLVWTFVRMGRSAEHYAHRLQHMDALLVEARQEGVRKLFVSKEDAESLGVDYSWGTGIESMLYVTARRGRENCSNLFVYEDLAALQLPELRDRDRVAFVPWWIFLHRRGLNAEYFPLPDVPFYFLQMEEGGHRFVRVE